MDLKPAESSGSRRRWHRPALLGGIVVGLAVAAGAWYVFRPGPPPELPPVNLAGADPEVAQAIEQAEENVRESPRSATVWGRLGVILAVHEFHAEALPALAEAERLDSDDPRWPYFQGMSLQLSDPERAIAKLRRAVELSHRPAAEVRLARLLLGQGQLDEAETLFRQAEREDPQDGRAALGRAQVARARGNLSASLAHLRRAADLPGTRKAAHILLAEAYAQLGKPAEADRARELAARLPDDPAGSDPYAAEAQQLRVGQQARLDRAIRLRQEGHPKQALDVFRESVERYPRNDLLWLGYGATLLDLQQYAAAERTLREAVRVGPGRFDARFALGLALYQQRDLRPGALAGAETAFRDAIRLFPNEAQAHYYLGVCLYDQGRWTEAASAYRTAVSCRPDYAEAHRGLGQALTEIARRAAAATALQGLVGCPATSDVALPVWAEAFRHLRDAARLTASGPASR